ncbi:MAG: NADH:ubiquinone reductase (Na(+)-transporting) subunit F [Puniceicoccaceae bacterium]
MLDDLEHASAVLTKPPKHLDYSLTGENATKAVEKGLAEADWYQCPVPRATMRKLLERKNGPAIRDTIIWFGLIFGFGYGTFLLWGTWWAVLPYLAYAALYAGSSDSRWHESSHGTAFRTDWMNNALYEIASFMVMRESVVWRWSHTRHHSDTIIVGRDPEIAVPRPPDIKALILSIFNLTVYPKYFKSIVLHSLGRMSNDEKTFIPETEFEKIYRNARIYVLVYASVIVLSIYTGSFLPLFYVGLTNILGSWLMVLYGLTQHAGLAENVLDHRLNCRTVYMNPIHRFLYWNMNYHVEHHMFPLVPYHKQRELHEAIKDDCPDPYPNLIVAYKEIIPAILRQVKEPAWHVKRKLPEPKRTMEDDTYRSESGPDSEGWMEICAAADLGIEDVIRFDHGTKTYALYRDIEGQLYASDGFCTHGNTHLADGLVKGRIVECPKHNGRFNLSDGSPARAPICRGLVTYPIEERNGRIWLNISQAGGDGAREEKTSTFKVISNTSVSTFIKELVLEPASTEDAVDFQPGDYMQLDIPTYPQISFRGFDIPEPYASVWERQHVFELVASNEEEKRRNNYSLASNPKKENILRFNVRIATPPPGQDCPPGIGSSFVFNLKPGDSVTAIGPFGDFHIKPTQREMVYIGGGAGMAPMRAHLAHLFENENTPRKVSYWYGARSRQEIYYQKYFEKMAEEHHNFSFNLALSEPLEEDNWTSHTGFIHEVVLDNYLEDHANVQSVEFYLCGPPMMIKACTKMLTELGVAPQQIAYDEF